MDHKTEQDVVIYINSKNKSTGIVGDFTVNLTRPITQIKGFQILGVEIPYSWYNIRIGDAALCRKGGLDYVDYFYPNAFTFTTANNTLIFNINGQLYPVNLSLGVQIYVTPSHGPARWINMIYTLSNTIGQLQTDVVNQLPGCSACSITYTNYKISIALTMTTGMTSVGVMLNGSTFGSFIGLAYDNINYYNVLVYNTTIIMQHEISFVNDVDLTSYGSELISVPSIDQTSIGLSGSITNGTASIVADYINLNDYDRSNGFHPLARLWGYTSSASGPTIVGQKKVTTPIRPPLFFDTRFGVTATINDGGINQGVAAAFNNIMAPGNYSYTDLCAAITANLASSFTDPATTTTFNTSTGLFTITFVTNINMLNASFVVGRQTSPGGLRFTYLLDQLGFTNRTFTTVNETTFTVTSTIPFPLRPKNIYISSKTLSTLKNTNTTLDLDNPSTIIQNVIYRVPIQQFSPGTIIRSKQLERPPVQVVNGNTQTITSIDLQIWHEDGDLVDLNGLDWSIGIRIIV